MGKVVKNHLIYKGYTKCTKFKRKPCSLSDLSGEERVKLNFSEECHLAFYNIEHRVNNNMQTELHFWAPSVD